MKAKIDGLRPGLLVGVGIIMGILMSLGWGAYNSRAQAQRQAAQPAGNCQTFQQTGYTVCGKFLTYWQGHGGLAQQGYPISQEFTETSDLNGKPYTVQYFERAVFEMHPENAAPNDVLLSQLGTFLGKNNYGQGFPTKNGQVPFYEKRDGSAIQLLKSYYNAINRKDYERAYSYFQGAPNPDPSTAAPYQQFVQGFADTASVTLAVGKETDDPGAGNIYAGVPVVITSQHTTGNPTTFSGCYFMHRVNFGISANHNDELWSIQSAKLVAASPNLPIDSQLSQTCTR